MDWHDLHKMKVTDLRTMAKEQTQLEGVTGMHKEELVEKLAAALGIPKPHKVVEAEGKGALKKRIRQLKLERDGAIEAHDPLRLRRVRNEMHGLKRRLRRLAHLTH
jgi:hypothetical protein